MPTASGELRNAMLTFYDGDGGEVVMDGPPLRFLLSKGWTEKGGLLTPPVPLDQVSDQEFQSALYLRDEWDYDFAN